MTKFYDRGQKPLTIEEVKSLRENSGFTLEISEDELDRAIDLDAQLKSQIDQDTYSHCRGYCEPYDLYTPYITRGPSQEEINSFREQFGSIEGDIINMKRMVSNICICMDINKMFVIEDESTIMARIFIDPEFDGTPGSYEKCLRKYLQKRRKNV